MALILYDKQTQIRRKVNMIRKQSIDDAVFTSENVDFVFSTSSTCAFET